MAKKKQAPLRAALDNHLGRNYGLEKQRKQEKAASKRKERNGTHPKAGDSKNAEDEEDWEDEDDDADMEAVIEDDEDSDAGIDGGTEPNVEMGSGSESDVEDDDDVRGGGEGRGTLLEGLKKLAGKVRGANPDASKSKTEKKSKVNGVSSGNTKATPMSKKVARKDRAEKAQQEDGAEDEDENQEENDDEDEDPEASSSDSDIPLSDLSSITSDQDILPHQRLTINNTGALTRTLASIALPTHTLPFSTHQSITSPTPTSIPDPNDDLNRELSLYAQSLSAVQRARALLLAENIPFTRPTDYFAEMVKSDEHMTRVKTKLVESAASKKASAEARKQRDAKKFGKQVQQERVKERAAAKRDMLEKVGSLKRKRASEGGGAGGGGQREEELFDVALEDAAETEKKERAVRRSGGSVRGRGGKGGGDGGRGGRGSGGDRGEPNAKRQKKDAKFGFGGKKRFSKSGDAESSADMRGLSTKRMKGQDSGARGGGGGGRGRGGARGGSRGGVSASRGGGRGGSRGGARGGGAGVGARGSKRLGKSRRAAAS